MTITSIRVEHEFDNGNWLIEYVTENGKRHREDGPAVIRSSGWEEWYVNGEPHRVDGPAYSNDRTKEYQWVVNSVVHRIDGPACMSPKETRWYINGCNVDTEIRVWAINMSIDLDNLTDDDKILIQLKFGDTCA